MKKKKKLENHICSKWKVTACVLPASKKQETLRAYAGEIKLQTQKPMEAIRDHGKCKTYNLSTGGPGQGGCKGVN